MTPSGGQLRQLTSNALSSMQPSFSPDGKKIVFVRHGEGVRGDLWTMNVDGSHKRRLTSTAGIDEVNPAWSPVGKEIAFTVDHPVKLSGIWVVTSNGTHRRRLAGGDAVQPTWSPDGEKIGFTSSDGKAYDGSWIWAVPSAGGTPTRLTNCGLCWNSDWSPDGRQVLFIDLCANWPALFVKTLGARGEGDVPGGACGGFPNRAVWSPDGTEILWEGTFNLAYPNRLYVLSMRSGRWQCCRTIPNSRGAHWPSWQPRPR
jgi:Tol biopolymer transport system component